MLYSEGEMNAASQTMCCKVRKEVTFAACSDTSIGELYFQCDERLAVMQERLKTNVICDNLKQ